MSEEKATAEEFLLAFGKTILTISSIAVFVPFMTLIGAMAGWAVGLVFSDAILSILTKLGAHDVTMWQFGAFMGFVGGFLKTKVTAKVTAK